MSGKLSEAVEAHLSRSKARREGGTLWRESDQNVRVEQMVFTTENWQSCKKVDK